MLQFSDLTNEAAVANQGEAMEADTISKNWRSSKSQISRQNIMQMIFLFFPIFCVSMASIYAQDVITLKNGMKIEVVVQETSEDNVKFKKYDNIGSTVYSLNKWEISTIMYANGSKEEVNVSVPESPNESLSPFASSKKVRMLEMEKDNYKKKMRSDFENRMNICGFTKRIVVFDYLNSLKDNIKKLHADKDWCTVGIWLNYQKRLVALRLDKDNWNEVIVQFSTIRSVESLVDGFAVSSVSLLAAQTSEYIKSIQVRIVAGDINIGTQAYILKLIGDGSPFIAQKPNWPINNSQYVYYKDVAECVRTIVDEIDLIMNN